LKAKFLYAFCVIIIGISIGLRFPKINEKNYYNEDATHHVLLTITAYDKTPASIHKFLPIVTLGEPEDKNIPWGATIPDAYGNYYYTSFSPAGFLAPYLFFKIFQAPVNEIGLYIFNSILYALCFLVACKLFISLFSEYTNKNFIILTCAMIYLSQPEILHSQGITYWHHSLFQLLFLLQLCVYVKLKTKLNYFLFFMLCFITPYVEWSGYVSNVGFAISFFLSEGIEFNKEIIKIKSKAFFSSLATLILTAASFALFTLHYLSAIPAGTFFKALKDRFFARNFLSNVSYSSLIKSYFSSFGALIFLVAISLIIVAAFKKTRKTFLDLLLKTKKPVFVSSFIMIENLMWNTALNVERVKR
jgi:hypothetical protein